VGNAPVFPETNPGRALTALFRVSFCGGSHGKIVGMADIDQNENSDGVIFSALNGEAQTWMRENYENESVIFRFPADDLRALEFRRAAEERGFKIDLWKR
jgi:hypothetical protein